MLTSLLLGPYRLEVALSGFRTFVQTGIVLQVNASPVVDVVLEVGQLEESVSVEANTAMVRSSTRAATNGRLAAALAPPSRWRHQSRRLLDLSTATRYKKRSWQAQSSFERG